MRKESARCCPFVYGSLPRRLLFANTNSGGLRAIAVVAITAAAVAVAIAVAVAVVAMVAAVVVVVAVVAVVVVVVASSSRSSSRSKQPPELMGGDGGSVGFARDATSPAGVRWWCRCRLLPHCQRKSVSQEREDGSNSAHIARKFNHLIVKIGDTDGDKKTRRLVTGMAKQHNNTRVKELSGLTSSGIIGHR